MRQVQVVFGEIIMVISKRFRYQKGRRLNYKSPSALRDDLIGQFEEKVESGAYLFERVDCPICRRSTELVELSQIDCHGLYTPVVICRECGLVQTNPRLTMSAYDAFYNNEYFGIYKGRLGPDDEIFSSQEKRGENIYRYLADNGLLPGKAPYVVEVGCGAGGLLRRFADKGARVLGVDLGKEAVSAARQRYGLNYVAGTLKDLDLTEKPDVVIYSHVLEHIPDPVAELNSLREMISDDTILYVSMPGLRSSRDLLSVLRNAHVYHFSLHTLEHLLALCGFTMVKGSEAIEAVFKRAPDKPDQGTVRSSDYRSMIRFIRKNEQALLIRSVLTKLKSLRKKILAGQKGM